MRHYRRQAQLAFGGLEQIKEATRDVRGVRIFDGLQRDLRHAARMLIRQWGFVSIIVVTLAIGIGANTAVFSVFDTIVLRPLPVHEPEELVEFLSRRDASRSSGFSWEVYERYREGNRAFTDLIATSATPVRVSGSAEPANGEYVSGNFFSALGLQPALGRLLGVQDDHATGGNAVVVLSWPYWQRRFGGDRSILERPLVIGTVTAIVIGVAPREFTGLQVGRPADMWMPSHMDGARVRKRWGDRFAVQIMARLKPGLSLEQAQAEMRVLDRRRVEELATVSGDVQWRNTVLELERGAAGFSRVRDAFATPLLILMLLVGLLLAIACTNIANMLLARSAARQKEMAVRVSLGASRLRLVQQVVVESLVLAALGAVVASVLAFTAAQAVSRIVSSGRMIGMSTPLEIPVAPDIRVLLFTVGVAILAAVAFGSVPAWAACVSAPASFLRNSGLGVGGRSRRMFGRGLVVAQVALSIMLLGVAGVFASHLSNLRNVGLGFVRPSVLLVTLDMSKSGHALEERALLFERLLERLKATPGVHAATLSSVTPIQGTGAASFIRADGHDEPANSRQMVPLNWVAPGYFETFGTPLLRGRDFRFDDVGAGPVAIVNEATARDYFNGDPIGRHVTLIDGSGRDIFERLGQKRSYEIVGVVGDAKYDDLRRPPPQTIYFNAFQENRGAYTQFALRSTRAPMTLIPEVRQAVANVLHNVSVSKATTVAEQMDASIVPERLTSSLSGGFGAVGAVLALIGLYGLLSYSVAQRRNEIGVRMAFGASSASVSSFVLKDALTVVGAGLVAGVPVAIWMGQFAANTMGIDSASVAAVVAVASALFLGVALLAAWAPAHRATRIDPIVALRCE